MKNSRLISLSLLIIASAGVASALEDGTGFSAANGAAKKQSIDQDLDYSEYGRALQYVDEEGLVEYKSLKVARGSLDRFAGQLADLPKVTYDSWDDRQKISFWSNAYNSLTMLAIVNHYPIEASFLGSFRFPRNSIRQISGVWNRLTFEIMGTSMTLDQIEHEVLRKEFDEPRIHVALVCAALGCPPLRNEPYEGQFLDKQLDDQAKRFFGNQQKFRINRETNTVYLSRILDWYGGDFQSKYRNTNDFEEHGSQLASVLEFASGYLSPMDESYLREQDYSVQYLDYDWSLNEKVTH